MAMDNHSFSPGTVTLVGSGEMSPSMGKMHRAVMAKIAGIAQPVFLDTPAGFELNADQIAERAIEYFQHRLNLNLDVVSFKAAATATPKTVEDALLKLRRANYIFAGPGSPTYAVRNWRDTEVFRAMAQRLAEGAHLVLASAAAIAVGRHVLPVYEIYKVGEDPRWVDGLDLLGPYGLELAIIPHWNNNEGGAHDTRYCFVGEPRMMALERELPNSATILGVDEYTACIVDLGDSECQVIGAGQVTIRQRGREDKRYPAGTSFPLGKLVAMGTAGEGELARAVSIPVEQVSWPELSECDECDVDALVDLLVSVRANLREARQWDLADEIRNRLAELGIVLEDGPTGTTWKEA
jgi:hypothetical protein